MSAFDQFTHHQYLNLETFRKTGAGVKTPVWFVQEGDTLFILTFANSGKVKRIRNNNRVNIAPCGMDGTLLGDWISATAHQVIDQATERIVDRLLDKKYGLKKKMFALSSSLPGRKYTVLEIMEE